MNLITEHIQLNKKELANSSISPQRKRHIQQELDALERYRERHPSKMKDPSPLELFCDENPDASECRMFEV
jgi:hypothetical protein